MMATKIYSSKKTILALGVMLATSFISAQVQADQLADIKAAGVVKVATFDANPPFGSVDPIVADITITPERAQVIDFSVPYFVTGQQFLVPVSSPDKLDEYSRARIGAVKGTTGEQALHQRFPQSRVLAYDDIPHRTKHSSKSCPIY